MTTITHLVSLCVAVARYDLRVIRRLPDDGGMRVYLMARSGSGARGGHLRNTRKVILTRADDCEAHRAGLLKGGA